MEEPQRSIGVCIMLTYVYVGLSMIPEDMDLTLSEIVLSDLTTIADTVDQKWIGVPVHAQSILLGHQCDHRIAGSY
jgi:hypothetical protein